MSKQPLPRRLYWVILHLAIAAAFARLLVAPLVDRTEAGATDFTVFYTGWSLVLHDPAHVYDVEAQRRVQAEILRDRHFLGGVMTFYYPPHAAIALAPFGLLDFLIAFRLWMLVQIAATAVLVRWLLALARLDDRLDRWVLATAVLAFLPLLYSLQIGQLSILMTVALLGFWRAFDRGDDRRSGLALLALTAKAQLLPVPLLLIAATRRWRPLAWLAVWAAPLVALSAVLLGPSAWLGYPAAVRHLEGFVAGGSHDYMLNLRGWLTRLVGTGHDRPVVAVCSVVLVVATAFAYRLLRRQVDRRGPGQAGGAPAIAFAAALAVELPASLHLHLQDALVWAVPLVIFAAELRRAGRPSRRFESFALSWPLVFVLAYALETLAGHLLPVPPPLVLAAILLAWITRDPAIRGAR